MDRGDRVGCVVYLILIAWPDQWLRVAFIILLLTAETRLGDTELQMYDVKVKVWERRAVSAFACVLALSKILWWCTLCAAVCLAVRQALPRRTHVIVSEESVV